MKKLLFITAILMTTNILFAQIINIPTDYPTIQQGIDAADDGDTVLVDIGIYYENIHFKKITVASHYLTTMDTSYISQTIIDGNSDGSVVSVGGIYPVDNEETVLCGFTIRNGKSSYGGGISIVGFFPEEKFYFTYLIIENNIAEVDGGGIYCEYYGAQGLQNVSINNVIVRGNIAGWGSGIACSHSSPVIQNALFYNNLFDTTNSWTYGASVLYGNLGSKPKFINATITENVQSTPIPFGEWVNLITCDSLIITNSIIYNNGGLSRSVIGANYLEISYSNIQGETVRPDEGNINEDPMFMMSGDHPYQINDFSPCIDAGTPDTSGLSLPELDLAGNPRIMNEKVDMGAYEWNLMVGENEPKAEIDKANGIWVYPNPVVNVATINVNTETGEFDFIKLYNSAATELKSWNKTDVKTVDGKLTIDLSNLPTGIYFLRLQAGNELVVKKVVKL